MEIYFSILQRKGLTPADFDSLAALEQRLLWFQWYYNQWAEPFRWNYTRTQLEQYLERLSVPRPAETEARALLAARRVAYAQPPDCLTH